VVAKDKDWTPPEPRSLLSLGAAAEGSGGGMKIGAGHKPQGYDKFGRYTGPRGGSISMDGGPVRLYADEAEAEGEAGEEAGAVEPEAGDMEAQEAAEEISRELEGVLVADSGQILSDAEGGLSGGYEVRGPVTPPPADVTWKNDDPNKPDPKPADVQPQMRETVENIRTKTPGLDSVNVNSGKRVGDPSTDPHADGRAVDINKVNGIAVKDLADPKTPAAERAQQAAKSMEEQAKKDPNVNQVIGPDGGWNKVRRDTIEPMPPKENKELLDRHKDHYHINVYRAVNKNNR